MRKKIVVGLVAALAAASLAGCNEAGGDEAARGGGAAEAAEAAAEAAEVGEAADTNYTYHAIVTCQSAGLYANYSPGDLKDKRYDMPYGDKVGVRKEAGDSYAAVILDYGPDVWGFARRDCLTRCWGANNPIAGCFLKKSGGGAGGCAPRASRRRRAAGVRYAPGE